MIYHVCPTNDNSGRIAILCFDADAFQVFTEEQGTLESLGRAKVVIVKLSPD